MYGMKKVMFWLFITSIIVFFIDWGVVGIKLLNGEYDITVGVYIALGCVIVMLIYILYRLFNNRCPHCGMIRTSNGKYCSFCGEKIDD